MTQALRIALSAAGMLCACTADRETADYGGYPPEIGAIITGKCAVSGCHNTASKDACAGLDLGTWEKLFAGSRANSAVVPYSPANSFLLFSVNTFDDLGPKLSPPMPYGKPTLERSDVIAVREWIAAGAPDSKGFVKWSDNPGRKKIYVVNQGCDLLTVFDADSKLIMRCIDAGNSAGTEAPHDMHVSPDGQYLYISYYAGSVFHQYRTDDHVRTGEINLTDQSWHAMAISGDSKRALVTHLAGNGKVALISLPDMQVLAKYESAGRFVNPHGCTLNQDGSLAYITSQQGNYVYKVDLADPLSPDISRITLEPGDLPSPTGIHKPYDVEFAPGYASYAVSCQGTNEVRLFRSSDDSLLAAIPTGGVPQVLSFSEKLPYLFVPCMEDTANGATQSSVYVIDVAARQVIASVYTGYDPRSTAVDDDNGLVWVANRNLYGAGWAPHHTTECAGRNGYITLIDMNTLQLVDGWKAEVSVDPYHIAVKK